MIIDFQTQPDTIKGFYFECYQQVNSNKIIIKTYLCIFIIENS